MSIQAQQPARDQGREVDFLERASSCGGTSRFVDHARQRLARGERRFGDRWTRRTMEEFLDELAEEAADLGAWAVLADQALAFRSPDMPEMVREALVQIARAGADAHRIVESVRRDFARHQPPGKELP